jgi:hypothetical protein
VSKNAKILLPETSLVSVPDASWTKLILFIKIVVELVCNVFEKRIVPALGIVDPDGSATL